jgi:hypothetical protein
LVHAAHDRPLLPHDVAVPPSSHDPPPLMQPAQLVSAHSPPRHCCAPTHWRQALPPLPQTLVVGDVMHTPALVQQPLHVAAQDRPPSPLPPPPPLLPPWPRLAQVPSVQNWFSVHVEHAAPAAPQAALEPPS